MDADRVHAAGAGTGIHALFEQSDQRYYWLPCPHGHAWQRLTWAANVDCAQARLVCAPCRRPLDIWAEGAWRATAPGNTGTRGYHLSRLYSPLADFPAMVRQFHQATTPGEKATFHNEVLGDAQVPATGRLTPDVLDRCQRDYCLADYAGQPYDIGVDVGDVLQVVVRGRPNAAGERPLWLARGDVPDFAPLARVGNGSSGSRSAT